MASVAKPPPPVREKVADLGQNLELWRVHIDEIKEQAKNARPRNRILDAYLQK